MELPNMALIHEGCIQGFYILFSGSCVDHMGEYLADRNDVIWKSHQLSDSIKSLCGKNWDHFFGVKATSGLLLMPFQLN